MEKNVVWFNARVILMVECLGKYLNKQTGSRTQKPLIMSFCGPLQHINILYQYMQCSYNAL